MVPVKKDIAHACHIEPASLTSILNRMEKQHMIERKNLNGNRRSFHIFLTDYGIELSESIEKSFYLFEQEVFSGISNAEKEQFLKIFENYIKILQKRSKSHHGKTKTLYHLFYWALY